MGQPIDSLGSSVEHIFDGIEVKYSIYADPRIDPQLLPVPNSEHPTLVCHDDKHLVRWLRKAGIVVWKREGEQERILQDQRGD